MLEQPIRDRRAERHAATRSEILDAAWEVARAEGLAAISLRDVARRVGMQAPSLYSYFDSKHAIYDAMFAQGQDQLRAAMAHLPEQDVTRKDIHEGARVFFDFCTEDEVRYFLLFQRVLPGFVPSDDSYALAVRNLGRFSGQLRSAGVHDPRAVDLWTALLSGLTAQQISNDPGGDRWSRLLDESVELLCDHIGVPR